MTDRPGSVQIGYMPPGNEMYGTGKVLLVVGGIATYIDPPTARSLAVMLILNAEKAGLPPELAPAASGEAGLIPPKATKE